MLGGKINFTANTPIDLTSCFGTDSIMTIYYMDTSLGMGLV